MCDPSLSGLEIPPQGSVSCSAVYEVRSSTYQIVDIKRIEAKPFSEPIEETGVAFIVWNG